MRRMISLVVPLVAVLIALPFMTLGLLGSRVVSAHPGPHVPAAQSRDLRFAIDRGLVSASFTAAPAIDVFAAIRTATGIEIVAPPSASAKLVTLAVEWEPLNLFLRRLFDAVDLGGFVLGASTPGGAQDRVVVFAKGQESPSASRASVGSDVAAAPEIVEVTVLEPPGAVLSVARGINAAGDITGEYRDASGRTHGWFLGKNDDAYVTLDYPISTMTVAQGINSRGDIVGFFNDPITRMVRGWLLSKHGTWSAIDVEGATATFVRSINSHGTMLGQCTMQGMNRSFVRDRNGTVTQHMFPGSHMTIPGAINDKEDLVGFYGMGTPAITRGYLLSDGEFSTIHVPGYTATTALGINARGDIVGRTTDAAGINHGYILRDGEYHLLDVPGAKATIFVYINARGDMVGQFTGADNKTRGFKMSVRWR